MTTTKRQGPIVEELTETPSVSPADAPPIPDQLVPVTPVQTVAMVAARRPNVLARWFWRLLVALIGFAISVTAWNFVTSLITQNQVLGYVALALVGMFVLVCGLIALREVRALMRLSRVDRLQADAKQAIADGDLEQARAAVNGVEALYRNRDETDWGEARFQEQKAEVFDADGLLGLAEQTILVPLDRLALQQVEAATRQVATVTALVPIALADVITALTANLRMIRQIAEIYGGRGGTLGSLRLTRSVLAHLVATGAVAVGDDVVSHVAGGGILSKFSRKFGEGIINGALTARVGVAAIEVCRPLPFGTTKPPKVTAIMTRSLTGLWRSEENN